MQWHTRMHSTIHSINKAEENSQIYGRIRNTDPQSLDQLPFGPSPLTSSWTWSMDYPVDLP